MPNVDEELVQTNGGMNNQNSPAQHTHRDNFDVVDVEELRNSTNIHTKSIMFQQSHKSTSYSSVHNKEDYEVLERIRQSPSKFPKLTCIKLQKLLTIFPIVATLTNVTKYAK
jgi:hypothetical protein